MMEKKGWKCFLLSNPVGTCFLQFFQKKSVWASATFPELSATFGELSATFPDHPIYFL